MRREGRDGGRKEAERKSARAGVTEEPDAAEMEIRYLQEYIGEDRSSPPRKPDVVEISKEVYVEESEQPSEEEPDAVETPSIYAEYVEEPEQPSEEEPDAAEAPSIYAEYVKNRNLRGRV